jgi:predicted N-acyltransferase
MRVQVARSIHEFEPSRWDAVAGSRLPLSHAWLRLLETGALGYHALYLLVEDEQGPLAAAVSPAWAVEWWERAAFRQLLALYPPYSASTSGLALREGCSLEATFPRLEPLLRKLAWKHGRLVTSLTVTSTAEAEYLQKQGFRTLEMSPGTVLPIQWSSYEDYLAAFPSRVRTGLGRSRRRAEKGGARVQVGVPILGLERQLYALLAKTFTLNGSKSPPPFSERFFSAAVEQLGERVVLIAGYLGDELVGYVLAFHDHHSMITPLAGFDEKARDAHVYFVVLQEALRWAIEHGLRRIYMGTTNYHIKERMGFQLQPRIACYRPSARLLEPMVSLAAPWLERSYGYRASAEASPEDEEE